MLVATRGKSAAVGMLVAAAVIAAMALSLVRVNAQQDGAAPPHSDTVKPGDLLCIGVAGLLPGELETLKTVHVNGTGEVSLFYVGQVKIGGLRFDQAERVIAAQYNQRQLVVDAPVTVNRLDGGGELRTLGPGDRVSIRIEELTGDGGEVRRVLPISGEGNVGLPLLGQLHIGGLEEWQAEVAIAKAYESHQILQQPAISVVRLKPTENEEPTVESLPAR